MENEALIMPGEEAGEVAKTTPTPESAPTWWQKNAAGIADLAGSLAGLAAYALLVLLLLDGFGFFTKDSAVVENFGSIAALVVVGGLAALALTFVFEWKSRKYEIAFEENEKRASEYVLSAATIGTLKAVGVARDVTKSLTALLDAGGGAPLVDGWPEKLKADLGPARFEDVEPTIRKYTRREKIK